MFSRAGSEAQTRYGRNLACSHKQTRMSEYLRSYLGVALLVAYEKDIQFLQAGQPIEARVEPLPTQVFSGRLALVSPRLDAATRTNRVRFELATPGHQLRPGMFATVTIKTPLVPSASLPHLAAGSPPMRFTSGSAAADHSPGTFPVVPERSVVDTGTRKIVYIEREAGLFDGVELGPRVALRDGEHLVAYYPVLKGLRQGERVAAAGAFLIDAETRLNPAAAARYFGASGGPSATARGGSPASGAAESLADQAPGPPPAEEPTDDDLANVARLPDGERQQAPKRASSCWCT